MGPFTHSPMSFSLGLKYDPYGYPPLRMGPIKKFCPRVPEKFWPLSWSDHPLRYTYGQVWWLPISAWVWLGVVPKIGRAKTATGVRGHYWWFIITYMSSDGMLPPFQPYFRGYSRKTWEFWCPCVKAASGTVLAISIPQYVICALFVQTKKIKFSQK